MLHSLPTTAPWSLETLAAGPQNDASSHLFQNAVSDLQLEFDSVSKNWVWISWYVFFVNASQLETGVLLRAVAFILEEFWSQRASSEVNVWFETYQKTVLNYSLLCLVGCLRSLRCCLCKAVFL